MSPALQALFHLREVILDAEERKFITRLISLQKKIELAEAVNIIGTPDDGGHYEQEEEEAQEISTEATGHA
jgi:hypothetical protein